MRPKATGGISSDDSLMAALVLAEARGEGLLGMVMVAETVVNRFKHPKRPHWYGHKKSGKRGRVRDIVLAPNQYATPTVDVCDEEWEAAQLAVRMVLGRDIPRLTGGATHFHAAYVSPEWASSESMTETVRYGGHIFYREEV